MVSRAMPTLLRVVLWALAYVHTFPARRHLVAFFEAPSPSEAWKGLGAFVAIALYLLPLRIYVRVLGILWRHAPRAFVFAGWFMALAHAVPAADHLMKFLAHPCFADGWRGFGAASACAWFLLPLPIQARAITRLKQLAVSNVGRAFGLTMKRGAAPPA